MAEADNNEALAHDQNLDVHNRPFDEVKPIEEEVPNEAELNNEDHLARIRELAVQLPEASPSGASTISQKILFHLDAHANPEEFNRRHAEEQARLDEEERIRAERRADVKKPVEPKEPEPVNG